MELPLDLALDSQLKCVLCARFIKDHPEKLERRPSDEAEMVKTVSIMGVPNWSVRELALQLLVDGFQPQDIHIPNPIRADLEQLAKRGPRASRNLREHFIELIESNQIHLPSRCSKLSPEMRTLLPRVLCSALKLCKEQKPTEAELAETERFVEENGFAAEKEGQFEEFKKTAEFCGDTPRFYVRVIAFAAKMKERVYRRILSYQYQ
jgi:hypothetical protein